ncbi:hypothetical protein [Streptomyces sp. NPDC086787]|uniref:Rv1733c family protein n=1 Tax=Streptomyces sp. NPDC086787 TaxID=3365759 RepID=UPI0037FBECBD
MLSTCRTRPTHVLGRHLRRALGAERNELARPTDRARSRALLFAALAVGLAALLGAASAWADFDSAQRRAAAAAPHLHRADAVLLTPPLVATDANSGTAVRYEATVAWTYPPERHHTGSVEVPQYASSGSIVRVWTGDTGQLSAAPPRTTRLLLDAMYFGLLVAGCLFVIVASGLGLRLGRLNRRADTVWQCSWAEVEPVWTGRVSRRHGNDDSRRG